MSNFILNPRLVTATLPVGDLTLCRVLLMDDTRYPWLLLVPRLPGVEELWDLTPADRTLLIEEIATAAEVIRDTFDVSRINSADIGNRAPQMHIHVVGRTTSDAAWPKVVWSRPYEHWSDETAFRDRQRLFQEAFRERAILSPIEDHTDPGVAKL